MVNVGIALKIDQKIIDKLSTDYTKLWCAAHEDDSDTRVNGEAIADASAYAVEFGAATAIFQGFRKLFHDQGKTDETKAAEKEAKKINDACEALRIWLLEYIQLAQKGMINEDSLIFLINRLEEIHGINKSGKMIIPGKEDLMEIQKSIEAFTADLAEEEVQQAETSCEDEFDAIRLLLIKQKEIVGN